MNAVFLTQIVNTPQFLCLLATKRLFKYFTGSKVGLGKIDSRHAVCMLHLYDAKSNWQLKAISFDNCRGY